ncbi:MAG: hemin receptor [Prevotella sp.]|nr:hemin receptor [Prevotella sp.]
MKKIVSLAVLSLAIMPVAAQDTYENARLLGGDLNGTARYVGMGGALDALGADISTISTNPAGIGLFRHNYAGISFGGVSQSEVNKFDHVGKTNMSFDQAGFVYSYRSNENSFINFAINYHKSKNFNQILSAANKMARHNGQGASLGKLAYGKSALGSDSKGGYYVEEDKEGLVEGWRNKTSDDRAYTYTQWDHVYTNGLMWDNVNSPAEDGNWSPYYNPNNIFFNNTFFEASDYSFDRAHNGWISDFDFNLSGNINNRVFLGITVGFHDVEYKGYSEYQEFLVDGNGQYIGNTVLADERRIYGAGVDVKVGAIIRPVEDSPFRIGLSIATPTWYDLKTRNATLLVNATDYNALHPDFRNWGYDEYSSGETYEYKYYTPWKFGLSLGHTVGNYLALGAGIDYSDYSTADNRINDGYDEYGNTDSYSDNVMNTHTENTLKGVATVKLGAEFKPDPTMAVRFGYNYVAPMYQSDGVRDTRLNSIGNWYSSTADYTNWDATHRITCGFGYKYEGWSFDVAYQYNATKGTFYPFQPDLKFTDPVPNADGLKVEESNISTPADVNFKRHQLLFTVGYTF